MEIINKVHMILISSYSEYDFSSLRQVLWLARPGDEMSEVVSRCLSHRQLWVINLSKVAMHRLKWDSTLRAFVLKHRTTTAPPRPIHAGPIFNSVNFHLHRESNTLCLYSYQVLEGSKFNLLLAASGAILLSLVGPG